MTGLTDKSPATEELALDHGLKSDEYARIVQLLNRTPNLTELGVFSAMWNEHCSYKSSKVWLKKLPSDGHHVICGPGENAGVVDIGGGLAAVFKMESHNHPSFIEPYQGAATGVGGILRDVFTMGARPVANLNALRFGEMDHPKTRHLVSGVVAGIGGYGNCVGVPTIAGEVNFHPRYNGNILVNAMTIGIARADRIFYSAAKGVGNPVVYVGSKTGRDGIHGASMASAEFDDETEAKRPTVQVGDPFTEKLLLEACLELMAEEAIIGIQDMGAAGLTSSSVEMASKGEVGIELKLDRVPQRERGMSAYELMLSESQERMLMVLRPGSEARAKTIFEKWDLDFAVIGETTDTNHLTLIHNGERVCHLPLFALTDEAPQYNRPFNLPEPLAPYEAARLSETGHPLPPLEEVLETLLASPDLCSRAWVWEQYDSTVMGDTVLPPGGSAAPGPDTGGNSGVVRVHGTNKGLAATADCTPRYVEAAPIEGGKQAVAEAWRNLIAVGATPLAFTNCLNFGNPEREEIMGQFAGAVEGMAEAARALRFPVVSGNVSLYNETNGRGILPTPTIGGVGLVERLEHVMTPAFKGSGEDIFLIGKGANEEPGGSLGQSLYLREVLGLEEGAPPETDLAWEARTGHFISGLITQGRVTAVHDLSDGGLAVALAEMALGGNLGARIRFHSPESNAAALAAAFFGEDQGRYVVTAHRLERAALQQAGENEGVPVRAIGETGGDALLINDRPPILLSRLREAQENTLPRYMNAAPA